MIQNEGKRISKARRSGKQRKQRRGEEEEEGKNGFDCKCHLFRTLDPIMGSLPALLAAMRREEGEGDREKLRVRRPKFLIFFFFFCSFRIPLKPTFKTKTYPRTNLTYESATYLPCFLVFLYSDFDAKNSSALINCCGISGAMRGPNSLQRSL